MTTLIKARDKDLGSFACVCARLSIPRASKMIKRIMKMNDVLRLLCMRGAYCVFMAEFETSAALKYVDQLLTLPVLGLCRLSLFVCDCELFAYD